VLSPITTAVKMLMAIIQRGALDPVRALYWSTVVNGVVATPLIVLMVMMARNRAIMGDLKALDRIRLTFVQWLLFRKTSILQKVSSMTPGAAAGREMRVGSGRLVEQATQRAEFVRG